MIVWRTVPQYPKYEASSNGHIRRKQSRFDPSKPGKVLSEHPGKKGYLRACVEDYSQAIAPLVCSAFHGLKPTSKHQAAHRNGVNTDNREDNLSWLTQSENYQDSIRHGTHKKGERCPTATLRDSDVLWIRKQLLTKKQAELSRELNISESVISRIALRHTWSHI